MQYTDNYPTINFVNSWTNLTQSSSEMGIQWASKIITVGDKRTPSGPPLDALVFWYKYTDTRKIRSFENKKRRKNHKKEEKWWKNKKEKRRTPT